MFKRIITKPFKIIAAAVSLVASFLKSAVLVIWSVTKLRHKKHKLEKVIEA